MSPTGAPRQPVTVIGGTGGFTANRPDILALGAAYRGAADDLTQRGRDLGGLVADPADVLASLFDKSAWPPIAGACSDAALRTATIDLETAASELRRCAAALDDISGKLISAALGYDHLDYGIGSLIGAFGRVVKGFAVADALFQTTLLTTHSVSRAAQIGLTAEPGVLDPVAVAALPSVSAYDLLAPDGHGVAQAEGADAVGAAALPPRNLTDVLTDLAQRDGGRHGEIDVRILTLPDGSRRAIVDITGTKSWDPLPTHDVTSLSTNTRALLGHRTAYEEGVLAAMHRAGIRRTDPVMLVGHSQGGMVAVNAARRAAASGDFDVTHVVTVGSPIGRSVGHLSPRIQVLAIENRADVIPHLDGAANPDQRNVTTVLGRAGDHTVSGDHNITASYEPIAADLARSKARSVRDFLASAHPYFNGARVATLTFQVRRR